MARTENATYEIITLEAGEWTTDYVGTENTFDTIDEALAAIFSRIGLGDEWATPDYGIMYGGELLYKVDSQMCSSFAGQAWALLPEGWNSLSQMCSSFAGQAWALDRQLSYGYTRPDWLEPVRREGGDILYAEVFRDGSLWVHSNACDEVWADWTDYTEKHDGVSLEELMRVDDDGDDD